MIRAARAEEAELLGALALRSKAHWGYTRDFMEACRAELSISPAYVARHPTFVLVRGNEALGFYTLEALSPTRVELGHLFVEPEEIGRGHGRALLAHARDEARRRGYRVLVIQGDPNAGRFYEACGARRVGEKASASIPGRMLPLFELDLSR
ncbi:GNAT family N-acetyltransferase [Sorangium sp. So ce1335]|uniref:GNAT family N-acetyltransferase n=1 Tax=Sorangium sp. So ce1335 TaxID=3133335 RepID=UPI003F5EA88D